MRSLENGRLGLNCDPAEAALDQLDDEALLAAAAIATPGRITQLEALLRRGVPLEVVHSATKVDPWFLDQILSISEERLHLEDLGMDAMDRRGWKRAKRLGFADAQLAYLWGKMATDKNVPDHLKPRIDVPWIDYVLADHAFDNSRLKSLGFEVKHPEIRSGLHETVGWYRQQRWLP